MMNNFPGPLGEIGSAGIDQFPFLVDALTTQKLRAEQVVKAEYFNDMCDSLETCWRYMTFLEGETSYDVASNVVTSVSGNVGLGEYKISSLTKPIVYSYQLSDLIGLYSSSHKTTLSGSMLPFELVITPSKEGYYKNHPIPTLVIENSTVFDYSRLGIISVSLSPFNSSFEFESDLYLPYIRYPQGYYNDLSTIWSITDSTNETIIKGFVIDNSQWYYSSTTVPGTSQWETLGSKVKINFSIVGIE